MQDFALPLDDETERPASGHADVTLSTREAECLLWLARGLRSAAIAERLSLAVVTVELHIKNARVKLGATTREHAVAKAITLGLIAP